MKQFLMKYYVELVFHGWNIGEVISYSLKWIKVPVYLNLLCEMICFNKTTNLSKISKSPEFTYISFERVSFYSSQQIQQKSNAR